MLVWILACFSGLHIYMCNSVKFKVCRMMVNYYYQNVISGDHLYLVYILGCKIFHPKCVKNLLKVIFLFYLTLILLQVYFLASQPRTFGFVKYGALMLQMCWAILGISVLLVKNNLIEDVMSSIKLWAINLAGKNVETKITRDSRQMNYYVLINTMIGLCWAVTVVGSTDEDSGNSLPVFIFQKWFFRYSYIFVTIFKSTAFVLSFTMSAHAYQVIYATQHIKFQIYLFNEYVKEIADDFNVDDEKLIYNEIYQKKITFRLKTLAKRHYDFMRWKNHTLDNMKYLIIPFSLGGCLVGTSVVLSFLQISNESPKIVIFRVISFAILAFSTFAGLLTAGQSLETESLKIRNSFLQTNWYTWNRENRKMLLVILANSLLPINLDFTVAIAINYDLGLAICKEIYSAASIFYNIK